MKKKIYLVNRGETPAAILLLVQPRANLGRGFILRLPSKFQY